MTDSNLRLGYPEEPDMDESELQPVEEIEDLIPHVGQYVYWRSREEQKWAQAKLIWTGDEESRFFDESVGGKFLREKVLQDPTVIAVEDICARLQAVNSTVVDVRETGEEEILAVRHDRNKHTGPGGKEGIGNHFALKLLTDDRDGNVLESDSTIILTPENLQRYQVSVVR